MHPSTERPLRVLTVARWYPSHDAPGRGSFVADLVRATASAGVDARVVSFDRVLIRGRLEDRDAALAAARAAYEDVATPGALFVVPVSRGAPGVPVARVPVVRRPGADDPAALVEDHLAALRPFVRRLVMDWRPDVIHAHTGLPDGIVATEIGRELGIPVVVTEHSSMIEIELADPATLERYRTLLAPGVRLLGVSPSVASRVASLLGVPVERIKVLPNPVADRAFPMADPAGRDPDELLWVGSLGEHKGIDFLLEMFAGLAASRLSVHLRLVGGERTAGECARWEARAVSLGIGPLVTFEGWLERSAVAAAMARASVFVHPSPRETFGVVAAEAILSGLPVAARQSGGVPWIVELSGGFGSVAAGDDAAAFAAAIDAVLDGRLAVDATTARARLVAAVGEVAVARGALETYRTAIQAGATAQLEARPRPGSPPGTISPTAALPRVLVATSRDHALRVVPDLPADLRERLVLVVPARKGGLIEEPDADPPIRLVEADPIPPPKPRPRGRGPLARLRRLLYRPAPTGEELLTKAILAASGGARTDREPVQLIALDAPAAVLIGRIGAARVRLAPGSLRWLADRWDAETPARR